MSGRVPHDRRGEAARRHRDERRTRDRLESPLPIQVFQPTTFTIDVTAQLPDGSTDTSFNGYVNILSQPGTVSNLDVLNVQLQNGVYQNLQSCRSSPPSARRTSGRTTSATTPAEPNRNPPPQCADGIDNNNNGLVDYPADPGCYAPVDDTEDLGTYASGASQTLYFDLPRIPLVRGYDPADNQQRATRRCFRTRR